MNEDDYEGIEWMNERISFTESVYSDEATFHVSGKANRHNMRV